MWVNCKRRIVPASVSRVIVIAAWVAAWRFIRALARRKAEANTPDARDGDA